MSRTNLVNQKQMAGASGGRSSGPGKLKILCLHGYRQDAEIFKSKLGGFKKVIKHFADLFFVNAPHCIVPESEETTSADTFSRERGWWFCDDKKTFSFQEPCMIADGFEESLEAVKNAFRTQGPFHGILGFSQGACLLSLICGLKENNDFPHDFKFAMFFSGFRSCCEQHNYLYEKPLAIPSFHCIGQNDEVVPSGFGGKLAEVFVDPVLLYHPGGHFVPSNALVREDYLLFFRKVIFYNIDEGTLT